MRLLIDTHSFLWFINDNAQLSHNARQLIEDGGNEILLSVASLWEIAIKMSIGKLNLGQPFPELFPRQLQVNRIQLLSITLDHLSVVATLPLHHRDPFDRLLIAQATVEQVPVVGVDAAFDAYGVNRLW